KAQDIRERPCHSQCHGTAADRPTQRGWIVLPMSPGDVALGLHFASAHEPKWATRSPELNGHLRSRGSQGSWGNSMKIFRTGDATRDATEITTDAARHASNGGLGATILSAVAVLFSGYSLWESSLKTADVQ